MTRCTVSRFVKFGLSCVVRTFDALADAALCAFRIHRQSRCVVLYYHEVSPRQRGQFARQLDLILRHAQPMPLDQPPPPERGGRYVAVTFDDGFCSVIDNALPELEDRAIPSTVFVVAGALGQRRAWATREAYDSSVNEQVMSPEQLGRLSRLVTIGSHSLTHPFFPTITEPMARRELNDSRRVLESIVGRKVDLFSFPYGGFDRDLVGWCREAGYVRVFTTEPLYAFRENDEFITGRVPASPDDASLEFRLKILGAYRWLPYAVALKRNLRWAILQKITPNTARRTN